MKNITPAIRNMANNLGFLRNCPFFPGTFEAEEGSVMKIGSMASQIEMVSKQGLLVWVNGAVDMLL